MQSLQLLAISICILLAGCTHHEHKKSIEQKIQEIMPVSEPYIPIEPKVALPEAWTKRVSITIGKTCAIKELIGQLAKTCNAQVNMDAIDDKVGITYSAYNTPFLTVLKEICRLVKWKVHINNRGDVTVFNDEPYFYTHEVAFLVNTDSRPAPDDKQASTSIKDVTHLQSEVEINLWTEIEDNMQFLLDQDRYVKNRMLNENGTGKAVAQHNQYAQQQTKYSINKQAGVLIVYGTQAQHEQIANFLRDLHMRVASQVFIEVHILSVEMGNDKQNGIDLNLMPFLDGATPNAAGMPVAGAIVTKDVVSAIRFIEKFGPTTLIHSPRTMTRNNVPAIFKSIHDLVYYKISAYRNMSGRINSMGKVSKKILQNNQNSHVDYTSEAKIVTSGIILVVRPMIIDFAKRIVALRIRANVSREGKEVEDPIVNIMGGEVKSTHPTLAQQSLETTITLAHGEVATIGGLITEIDKPGEFSLGSGRFGVNAPANHRNQIMFVVSCRVDSRITADADADGRDLSRYELMHFSADNNALAS
jgi:general secretion pathway protein D